MPTRHCSEYAFPLFSSWKAVNSILRCWSSACRRRCEWRRLASWGCCMRHGGISGSWLEGGRTAPDSGQGRIGARRRSQPRPSSTLTTFCSLSTSPDHCEWPLTLLKQQEVPRVFPKIHLDRKRVSPRLSWWHPISPFLMVEWEFRQDTCPFLQSAWAPNKFALGAVCKNDYLTSRAAESCKPSPSKSRRVPSRRLYKNHRKGQSGDGSFRKLLEGLQGNLGKSDERKALKSALAGTEV